MSLTRGQREVLALMKSDNRLISVLGSAGVGKTLVAREYMQWLQTQSVKYHIAAYTGVAASLYNDGQTIHSLFQKLCEERVLANALNDDGFIKFLASQSIKFYNGIKSPKQKSFILMKFKDFLMLTLPEDEIFYKLMELCQDVIDYSDDVLILDESSMIPKRMLSLIFSKFRFKKIILVGDKYQISPVVNNERDRGYCYSVIPPHTRTYELTEVVRQKNGSVLNDLALVVRKSDTDALSRLNAFFKGNFDFLADEDIKIFPYNYDKDIANKTALSGKDVITLYPKVSLDKKPDEIAANVEWLSNCRDPKDMIRRIEEHYLATIRNNIVCIENGGMVMNLRNQKAEKVGDSLRGYLANGNIGRLKRLDDGVSRHFRPSYNPDTETFSYKGLAIISRDSEFPVITRKTSFHSSTAPYFHLNVPAVQFAHAYTYHKMQGLTIEKGNRIGVYVPTDNDFLMKNSGLMYVALTRCEEFEQINLHGELTMDMFRYDFGISDSDVDKFLSNTLNWQTLKGQCD